MFYTCLRALILGFFILSSTPSWARSLILVDGILGDFVQSTFNGIHDQWNRSGQGNAFLIRPSSFESWETNSDKVLKEIRDQLASQPEETFIVMAHSRGAAELMLGLLRQPGILRERQIEKVVLVQGAFWGSPLADWVAENVDSKVDVLASFRPALKSLTTLEAQTRMSRAMRQCPEDAKPLFMEKVAFIRARQSFGKTRAALKAGHLYLNIYVGRETDGVLLTDRQFVTGFGQDWGVLEGDHFDWVEEGPKSSLLLERILNRL